MADEFITKKASGKFFRLPFLCGLNTALTAESILLWMPYDDASVDYKKILDKYIAALTVCSNIGAANVTLGEPIACMPEIKQNNVEFVYWRRQMSPARTVYNKKLNKKPPFVFEEWLFKLLLESPQERLRSWGRLYKCTFLTNGQKPFVRI